MLKKQALIELLNNDIKIGAHIFTCTTRKKPYKTTKQAKKHGLLTGRHATAYGYMCPDDLEIVINEQVAMSLQLETVIHEILHALIEVDGTRPSFKLGAEEKIVQAMGHGITQVLLDNPALVKAIELVGTRSKKKKKKPRY